MISEREDAIVYIPALLVSGYLPCSRTYTLDIIRAVLDSFFSIEVKSFFRIQKELCLPWFLSIVLSTKTRSGSHVSTSRVIASTNRIKAYTSFPPFITLNPTDH